MNPMSFEPSEFEVLMMSALPEAFSVTWMLRSNLSLTL
jgi:hypothetical protein